MNELEIIAKVLCKYGIYLYRAHDDINDDMRVWPWRVLFNGKIGSMKFPTLEEAFNYIVIEIIDEHILESILKK